MIYISHYFIDATSLFLINKKKKSNKNKNKKRQEDSSKSLLLPKLSHFYQEELS